LAKYVRVDPSLLRPAEVDHLLGDASKGAELGWAPTIAFKALVEMMVDDLQPGSSAPAITRCRTTVIGSDQHD
jgi:GDPmannose 4,6-dehydratase